MVRLVFDGVIEQRADAVLRAGRHVIETRDVEACHVFERAPPHVGQRPHPEADVAGDVGGWLDGETALRGIGQLASLIGGSPSR